MAVTTQLNALWITLGSWLLAANLAGYLLMAVDKSRAERSERRVSEQAFFRLAFAGGAFGIIAAVTPLRHRTLKSSFTDVVILAVFAWLMALMGLQRLLGPPLL